MTTQEQIEEIELVMHNAFGCRYFNTKDMKLNNDRFFNREATALYNSGYRKADEVRKEMAKEILQKIIEKDHKILAWEYGVGYMDCMQNIKSVISEYGVEVEE